jgi:hypothetical protein
MSRFKKATRVQARARIALVGPSGSGKTYTGLRLARGIVGPSGRIAVIDTERGSAAKYASLTDFDALELTNHHPDEYIKALADAAAEKYDAVIIDSLSHAWNGRGGALELVDKAAARSKSGNSFTAWRDVTPLHNALIDAILAFPGHVIVTMRAKTEYVLDEGPGGKKTPRKIGLAPVQRDGMEYEFDVVADIDHEHRFVVTKSRCAELADAVIMKPGDEVAEILRAWLTGGEPAPVAPAPAARTDAAPEPKREPAKEKPKGDDGSFAGAIAGSSIAPKALEHLHTCENADAIRAWFVTWLGLFDRLSSEEKRKVWQAVVDCGGRSGLEHRDLKALADEARATTKGRAA